MSEGKYIRFLEALQVSPKTKRWHISPKEGGIIGEVRWFGRWRQYSAYLNGIFEKTCLRDIANFCEEQTRLHYKELKESRKK